MNEVQEAAMAWGTLTTLGVVIGGLVWLTTRDSTPIERRAQRMAAIGATFGVGLVALAEWWLYSNIDATLGAYMLVPSIVLGGLAFFFGGKIGYQAAGGGKEENYTNASAITVEEETLDHQEGIWSRLCELPHLRETLSGELINLATGDRLYWVKLDGAKCVEMKLAGKTHITASRYQTLSKYLAVQEGIARSLGLNPIASKT